MQDTIKWSKGKHELSIEVLVDTFYFIPIVETNEPIIEQSVYNRDPSFYFYVS